MTHVRLYRVRPRTLPPDGFVDVYWDDSLEALVYRDNSGVVHQLGSGSDNSVVLTRTAAEGDPNGAISITLSGITSPTPSGNLVFDPTVPDINGRYTYENAIGTPSGSIAHDGTEWIALLTDGLDTYEIRSGASSAMNPLQVASWSVIQGAGPPVFTSTDGFYPGQPLIVGTTNPVEYTWDGAAWYLSGPAGVVADNESPGSYRRIIFDGGALSSESYTPAD